MKRLAFFLLISFLLAVSLSCMAQDRYVYVDSSILFNQPSTPVEEVQVVEAPLFDTDASANSRDTIFISNQLQLSADSLNTLRSEKQLAYAQYLDSLLKAYKKMLEQNAEKEKALRKKNRNRLLTDDASGTSWLDALLHSRILQICLWSMAGLFVLFILYKLFFGAGALQRFSKKDPVTMAADIVEEQPLHQGQYDAAIQKAVATGNYRLAVRYLYLQLLQRLSANGAIQLSADKTNSDYIREIAMQPYKEEVKTLTQYYEYVWYGQYAPGKAAYEKIEQRFKQVLI